MSVTIISNNCIAGTILHDMRLPLNTPTVNLQIMPEEFPMFCKMLPLCLKSELYEYKNISDKHKAMLLNMFGGIPECPLAICRGYMIVLQHYKTFEEGKEAWDRRKERINRCHVGFVFYLPKPQYAKLAEEFNNIGLRTTAIFTEGFDIALSHYRVDVPKETHWAALAPNGKRYYEKEFDAREFVRRISE